jgi:hypothetical protein
VDLENAIRQVIASDEYQASLPRAVEPPAFRDRWQRVRGTCVSDNIIKVGLLEA